MATALAVRAGSEIAEQLTRRLRRLIAAVAVLAAVCALGLVVQPEPLQATVGTRPPPLDVHVLRHVWQGAGAALLGIAVVLLAGASRIERMFTYGRRSAPRWLTDTRYGKVLNPERKDSEGRGKGPAPPRIRPPDCWLNANEGDLVPWGWLHPYPGGRYEVSDLTRADRLFWKEEPERLPSGPGKLAYWVRTCVGFRFPDE